MKRYFDIDNKKDCDEAELDLEARGYKCQKYIVLEYEEKCQD